MKVGYYRLTDNCHSKGGKIMTRAKIGTEIHQIRPYQRHIGYDPFPNEFYDPSYVCGGYYNHAIEKNIRVPIGDINELRKKLREK